MTSFVIISVAPTYEGEGGGGQKFLLVLPKYFEMYCDLRRISGKFILHPP